MSLIDTDAFAEPRIDDVAECWALRLGGPGLHLETLGAVCWIEKDGPWELVEEAIDIMVKQIKKQALTPEGLRRLRL